MRSGFSRLNGIETEQKRTMIKTIHGGTLQKVIRKIPIHGIKDSVESDQGRFILLVWPGKFAIVKVNIMQRKIVDKAMKPAQHCLYRLPLFLSSSLKIRLKSPKINLLFFI
jgi:hypothetical protein